jgi:RND family efflux transporter MFP subunit
MKKSIVIIFSLLTIVFVSSCSSSEESKDQDSKAINVNVAIASLNTQSQQLSYSAKVESAQFASLSTRISGTITSYHAKPGQKVKKGNLLLSIHNADLKAKHAQIIAAKAQAKSNYDIAQKDLERYQSLYNQNSASLKELERIQLQLEASKAQYEMTLNQEKEIKVSLAYSEIRAPFSGIITKKFMNTGELANPGMPLIAIEKQTDYNVLALVPESEISQINLGDLVFVDVKSAKLNQVKAKVIELNPSSQYSNNQYELKLSLQLNLDQYKDLRSGMFANVIIKRKPAACITIPKKALIHKGQLTGIYTISSKKTALLRWVRVGKINGDHIEILSGLKEGEHYISNYQGKIWDGASIHINK